MGMNNDITIDIDAILLLDDNSITDYETIRQIGLATTKWGLLSTEKSRQLSKKIKKEFTFAALYPHVHQPLNIKPEGMSDDNWKILTDLRDDLTKLRKK